MNPDYRSKNMSIRPSVHCDTCRHHLLHRVDNHLFGSNDFLYESMSIVLGATFTRISFLGCNQKEYKHTGVRNEHQHGIPVVQIQQFLFITHVVIPSV
jgi:hypothetical protein